MKLPTSLSVMLSALAGAIAVVSTQIPIGNTLHIVIAGGLTFLAGLGIHPQAESKSEAAIAPPYEVGAAAPPAKIAPVPPPAPAEQSLP